MAIVPGHVIIDDQGVAWIDQTRIKVIEVALDYLAHGSSPEEIHFQHPNLSLAQIHAALSYYHENEAAYQKQIACELAEVEQLRTEAGESPGTTRAGFDEPGSSHVDRGGS